ncbi:methyltransferase [Candidatus Poribacteria bacterium]|nr:methyltransferase [Candidatus Poribacteria bacterium]
MSSSKADPQSVDPKTVRQSLQNLIAGHRSTALIYVAAKLGIADLLAEGSRSSEELTRSVGAHAPSLHRILRGLVVLGILSEEEGGRFSLTDLGILLQADIPDSQHGFAILSGEEFTHAYGGLLHTTMAGETAFDHVFGMSPWEHREQHPELQKHFNQRMTKGSDRVAAAILAAYDFSPFHTIADVGGNQGTLLAAILKAYPAATGILFDQPHIADAARALLEADGVASRCQTHGGSFFESMPDGADLHILKSIIHDWDDEKSLAILRNCHRALQRAGTLLLVEVILPDLAEQDPLTILSDLLMLAVTGGRERTETEFDALFTASGFKLTRVVSTQSRVSLIEGVPV